MSESTTVPQGQTPEVDPQDQSGSTTGQEQQTPPPAADGTEQTPEQSQEDGKEAQAEQDPPPEDEELTPAAARKALTKTRAEAKNLRDRLRTTETENARLRVALTKGLPADLVPRLVGTTEDELTADADKLLDLMGSGTRRTVPAPPKEKGNQQRGPITPDPAAETDLDKIAQRIYSN